MLQLVNLSNYQTDLELIKHSATCLRLFLEQNQLDGLELMLCDGWDSRIHRPEWIYGVHLRFWPYWLDFWRGDTKALSGIFKSEAEIKACYGGLQREDWLRLYRENIRVAGRTGARYAVFHVSHTAPREAFDGNFRYNDREVVEAALEVLNRLVPAIPEHMTLLLENLWWPGMTLTNRALTVRLLEEVAHPNVGIMLDTGHLMNTNPALTTEEEGVAYIIDTVKSLGKYKDRIQGLHLHRSLSGEYVRQSRQKLKTGYTMAEVMSHVLRIDEHLPFRSPAVRQLIQYIQPEYVVHEFIQTSLQDWQEKVTRQQQALGLSIGR